MDQIYQISLMQHAQDGYQLALLIILMMVV